MTQSTAHTRGLLLEVTEVWTKIAIVRVAHHKAPAALEVTSA
jgi:hypothetical protein